MKPKKERYYNPTFLFELVNGDRIQLRKMEAIFVAQVNETIQKMDESVQAGDWLQVAGLAHRIKASIDIMQIEVLKTPIRFLEEEGRKGKNINKLEENLLYIKTILNDVISEILTSHQP